MKKTIIAAVLLAGAALCNAQEAEKSNPFFAGVEVASRYLWRGQEYGNAPAIFPTVGCGLGGFSIYATGAYTFDNSWREADLGVSYTLHDFTLGIADYYYPTPSGEKDHLFDFSRQTTGHLFEGYLSFASSRIPVTATVSTFFAGMDKNRDGRQAWSSYAELGYHYDITASDTFSVALGASLNESLYNDYETGFSFVNIAFKYQRQIPVGKSFTMPLSAQYVINPQKEKSFIAFSIGLDL